MLTLLKRYCSNSLFIKVKHTLNDPKSFFLMNFPFSSKCKAFNQESLSPKAATFSLEGQHFLLTREGADNNARKMESILPLKTKKIMLATFVLNTLTACGHNINWLSQHHTLVSTFQ